VWYTQYITLSGATFNKAATAIHKSCIDPIFGTVTLHWKNNKTKTIIKLEGVQRVHIFAKWILNFTFAQQAIIVYFDAERWVLM